MCLSALSLILSSKKCSTVRFAQICRQIPAMLAHQGRAAPRGGSGINSTSARGAFRPCTFHRKIVPLEQMPQRPANLQGHALSGKFMTHTWPTRNSSVCRQAFSHKLLIAMPCRHLAVHGVTAMSLHRDICIQILLIDPLEIAAPCRRSLNGPRLLAQPARVVTRRKHLLKTTAYGPPCVF